MRTPIRSLLCAALFLVPCGTAVRATDPARPAKTGKVLVLDNDRVLEGDIEQVGDQYRIRRLVGETWIVGQRVLFLGQTMEEAFAFLRGRANLQDADERLRLAHWCRQNGLHAQALAEVQAAVPLRPQHADSRRPLTHLPALSW